MSVVDAHKTGSCFFMAVFVQDPYVPSGMKILPMKLIQRKNSLYKTKKT